MWYKAMPPGKGSSINNLRKIHITVSKMGSIALNDQKVAIVTGATVREASSTIHLTAISADMFPPDRAASVPG